MSHLISGLLRLNDPLLITLTLLGAVVGNTVAFVFYFKWLRAHRLSPSRAAIFGVLIALAAWSVFTTALHGSFPGLHLQAPLAWAGPALALAALGSGTAAFNQARGRRSARNVMLCGSLVASGVSCMLFTAMAGMVQPFALSYDLSAVLATTVGASGLYILAFWEGTNSERRYPRVLAIALASLATVVSCVGSLSSILPFDGWLTAVAEPDDLSSMPLLIIVVSEAAVVLVLSLFGSLADNRAAARDKLETDRLRELAGSTFEAIVIHRNGLILDGNNVLAELTGQPLTALVGRPVAELCTENSLIPHFEKIADRAPRQISVWGSERTVVPVEILSQRISYAGSPAMASALRDVRERCASEARIRFLAHHDTLTELPNRALMTDTLKQVLARCAEEGLQFSLLCLDLDGFKSVNDTLGHAAGDRLLCEVADRLRANIRPDDFVARLGGDEFVVVTLLTSEPAHTADLAQRLIDSLSVPYEIEEKVVRISTSVGIAIYPFDGLETTILLRHADMSLYRAKQDGRGIYRSFREDLGQAVEYRAKVTRALQGALDRNEMALYFQPLFDNNKDLISFEALLRWVHPTLGQVSPAQFIPLAESSGLIGSLGEWALRRACLAAVGWSEPYRVAVNISPRQLQNDKFAELIQSVLFETGLDASRLELELTESALITNGQLVRSTLNKISSFGVKLALDDFGTGYSSLSSLHQFPFNKLKIDQSFVQRLEEDQSARSIVRTIAALGRSLGLQVTAEGIETSQQLQMVCDEGCHELQGYLLGKPMSEKTVGMFVEARASLSVAPNSFSAFENFS